MKKTITCPPADVLIDFRDAAARLGVSVVSIRAMCASGELHPVDVSTSADPSRRTFRVRVSDVEAFIERRTVQS